MKIFFKRKAFFIIIIGGAAVYLLAGFVPAYALGQFCFSKNWCFNSAWPSVLSAHARDDADGDGVKNNADKCDDAVTGSRGDARFNGCPIPQIVEDLGVAEGYYGNSDENKLRFVPNQTAISLFEGEKFSLPYNIRIHNLSGGYLRLWESTINGIHQNVYVPLGLNYIPITMRTDASLRGKTVEYKIHIYGKNSVLYATTRSVYVTVKYPDTDNDGIGDNVDRCSNTSGVSSNDGCPANTVSEWRIEKYNKNALALIDRVGRSKMDFYCHTESLFRVPVAFINDPNPYFNIGGSESALDFAVHKWAKDHYFDDTGICNKARFSCIDIRLWCNWQDLQSSDNNYDCRIAGERSPYYRYRKIDCY